jgi:hypothetical protein
MELTVNTSVKNAEILNRDELHRIPRHESDETRAYCYKPNFLACKTHYYVPEMMAGTFNVGIPRAKDGGTATFEGVMTRKTL